jgi:hypothetical protein
MPVRHFDGTDSAPVSLFWTQSVAAAMASAFVSRTVEDPSLGIDDRLISINRQELDPVERTL